MAKIKKFKIMRVLVEVEYTKPLLGRLHALYIKLKFIKLIKINILGSKYYRLYVIKYEVMQCHYPKV